MFVPVKFEQVWLNLQRSDDGPIVKTPAEQGWQALYLVGSVPLKTYQI